MSESIRCNKVRLDRVASSDLAFVRELFAHEGHTIGDGPTTDDDTARDWVTGRDDRYARFGLAWYVIRVDGVPVGTCGAFTSSRCQGAPEIGYEIYADYRNRGYASEAAAAVTTAIHDAGHAQVWATIRPANRSSLSIVGSLGYVFVASRQDDRGDLHYFLHHRE